MIMADVLQVVPTSGPLSGVNTEAQPPGHLYHDTVQAIIDQSIQESSDFLFDKDAFGKELCRLEEAYGVPYEVRVGY